MLDEKEIRSFLEERVDGPLKLHHEFRVSVSDCPNACSRPQIVDVGLIGARRPGVREEPCTRCLACVETCREDAVEVSDDGRPPRIDSDKCVWCGQCIDVCPTGTLEEDAAGYRLLVGGKLGRHPGGAAGPGGRRPAVRHPQATALDDGSAAEPVSPGAAPAFPATVRPASSAPAAVRPQPLSLAGLRPAPAIDDMSSFLRLRHYLRPYVVTIVTGILFAIVVAAATAGVAALLKPMFNDVFYLGTAAPGAGQTRTGRSGVPATANSKGTRRPRFGSTGAG